MNRFHFKIKGKFNGENVVGTTSASGETIDNVREKLSNGFIKKGWTDLELILITEEQNGD